MSPTMKKSRSLLLLLCAALPATNLAAASDDKVYPAVGVSIRAENEPNEEFCVAGISPPVMRGYDFATNFRSTSGIIKHEDMPLDAYMHESQICAINSRPIPCVGRHLTPALKHISLRYRARLPNGKNVLVTRLIQASVTATSDATSDASILTVGRIAPVARSIDLMFMGMPSAVLDAGNGIIKRWNMAVNSLVQKGHQQRLTVANVTDRKITNMLTVLANSEAVLLTQYACEDKKELIQRTDFQRYFTDLTAAIETLLSEEETSSRSAPGFWQSPSF